MDERIFRISDLIPSRDSTYREPLYTKNHEIHLWRIRPGEWIYPHTHPHSDDIWHIVQGEGEYYIAPQEAISVKPGDISIAFPGEVHGIFNSGSADIVLLSVLSPLPVEIEEVPGFEYPE